MEVLVAKSLWKRSWNAPEKLAMLCIFRSIAFWEIGIPGVLAMPAAVNAAVEDRS